MLGLLWLVADLDLAHIFIPKDCSVSSVNAGKCNQLSYLRPVDRAEAKPWPLALSYLSYLSSSQHIFTAAENSRFSGLPSVILKITSGVIRLVGIAVLQETGQITSTE